MSEIQTAVPLVPEWTAEDFMGDRPYALLYENKDRPFLFQQMMARTQAMAKKAGFPAFLKMWRGYVEELSPKNTIMGINNTDFPGQPTQLQCGKYSCDDRGVSYIGRMGEMIEVCPHPMMPVQRIINMDTNEEKLLIAYQRGSEKWRSLIAGRETLASAQKIIGLAKNGIAVNSENAREMVKYITDLESMNYSEMPSQNATGHMGWLQDGRFAPYCDDLVYDGDSPEFTRMYGNCQKAAGSEEKWMEMAKAVRAGNSVPARIALAASFASPLIKPLGGLPFFVHLWGTQGCGKTVGLMLAASVWGNPVVGQYSKTFSGTKNSFEMYASFCGNLPILFDELQIISDRKTFDDIIYMLCEGTSKSRGTKEGGLRLQQHWNATIITTGETPIIQSNSGGGAMVRTIEVNYGGQPLFQDARETAGILRENYGHAGRQFVSELMKPDVLDALKTMQKLYADELSDEIQDKQVLSASILLAADALADAVLFHDGKALKTEDIMPYLVTREQADANYRCWQWLGGYIAGNPKRFDTEENSGELWGIHDTDGATYIIRSFFDRILQSQGFSANAFLLWAQRNGKLVVAPYEKKNRLTVRKYIGGSRVPCVGLRLDEENAQNEGNPDPNVEKQTEVSLSDFTQVHDDDMPF